MTIETTNEDYKKYFDPKEYITHIVGVDSDSETPIGENDKEVVLMTSLLTDPKHRDVREETLLMLKKDKKEDVLLVAIAKQKDKNIQHQLVAACWESEINFSKYLPFFVMLLTADDYLVLLEAITVIQEMEGPFDQEQLKKAIDHVKKLKKNVSDERQVLLNDVLDALNGYLIAE
jgi:hypothetical protein